MIMMIMMKDEISFILKFNARLLTTDHKMNGS